jgi:hypothetical protein
MSDSVQADDWGVEPDDDGTRNPAGEIRIRSMHAFGLRAAALAGLVVTTASAAVVLSPLATIAGTGHCCVSMDL